MLQWEAKVESDLIDVSESSGDHFRLTMYDAAYLELAQRRTLPLATLDEELCAAAAALGVRVLGGVA